MVKFNSFILRLVEEVTNGDPSSPDAKTMTKIAEASFDTVEYWRIVDVLHRKYELVLFLLKIIIMIKG